MAKVMQRKTSQVKPRFNYYDGDDPTPGVYRARIKKLVAKKSSGDNVMLVAGVEFEAKEGSQKAKFDGFYTVVRVVFGEHDVMIEKEQGLYLAVCGKADAGVKTTGDPTKFKAGDRQETPVESIGGKNPVDAIVNVRMQYETSQEDEDGNTRQVIRGDRILPTRDAGGASDEEPDADEDGDEELEDEVEEAEEGDVEGYTEEELGAKSLAALRKILVDEFDFEEEATKAIKKKAELVQEILDQQDLAEESDEDEDEDEDEDDEADEADELEADEDDETPREDEIDEELEGMDRNAVKAQLKKRDPSRKFKVSETEEALKEELKELMLQDPPF